MKERTAYQEKIIKRYYNNRESLMQQKLPELVTELYLATGKKRQQIWKRISAALTNIGVDDAQIAEIIAGDDAVKLAKFLE
jgi:alkylhydroperoxidase/carboxymuconolactone decarboxylase family protein YurZ